MHASRSSFRVSLLVVSGSLMACAGARGVPSGPSSAPTSNVYLRNSFDTDPSIYLGRFVPRNAIDLDEGSAMPLTCTQYVKYRFIEGGGVKITESMSVSTEVAARIGVPIVASGQGSGSRTGEVKVEYTLTGKMVADVTDPAAFHQCCKDNPDQCTDRFIGEFLQGTGTVFRQEARELDVGGKGTDPQTGVSGSAAVSHDKQWTQAVEFPNPVYFAFKVTQTPNTRATSSCGTWVDLPPVEPGFVFFVGMSRDKKNERAARDGATRDAKFEAAKSVAASIPVGPEGEPDPAAQAAVSQWAMSMQIVESCVEIDQGGRKPRYVGRVLGKLPVFEGPKAQPPPPLATEPPASLEVEPAEPLEVEPAEPLEAEPAEPDPGADEDWGDGL